MHEHARMALGKVLSDCRDAQIDVLPVKGVLTARLFYADPAERAIQDVDLRVREGDLPRVELAGLRAGWGFLGRSRAYGTLSFSVLGFLVEFESHVGPPGLCGLRIADMLARARPCVEPLGFPHLEPELHDHVLHLCVNVFKDKLIEATPGAISDLEIVPTWPDFDPGRLVRLARATGSTTLVWLVARWLERARGSAGWRGVRERIGREPPRAGYARVFERAIAAPGSRRAWLRVLARSGADRAPQIARALGAMAQQGGESAWSAVSNVLARPRTGVMNRFWAVPAGGQR
jgi:hypothetical protein